MMCTDCLKDLPENLTFSDLFIKKRLPFQLCFSCRKKYLTITKNHCPHCFRQQKDRALCLDCQLWLKKSPQKSMNESLFQYNDEFSNWLERFKYQGALHLKYTFAKELRDALKSQKALLVPIPMDDEKLKIRGFNQTEELLLGAKLPYTLLLGKPVLEEKPQSQKNKKERMALPQVFYLKESALKKEIILVDDVYTTGTTLQKATEILLKNGFIVKKTFTLAR